MKNSRKYLEELLEYRKASFSKRKFDLESYAERKDKLYPLSEISVMLERMKEDKAMIELIGTLIG